MTEDFLHFVWQFRLFGIDPLKTTEGEAIEVISTGQPNYNAGPDFFNARIKIKGIEWAGNVELHIRASDWNRHGHQNDGAYNNVILHVVYEADASIQTSLGISVPCVALPCEQSVQEAWLDLYRSHHSISCHHKISRMDPQIMNLYIPSLAVERLERKSKDIYLGLEKTRNDWEDVFWVQLARNFGFNVNGVAFEMLARSVPYKIIAKHKNSRLQIESLLFGQSGLIPENSGHGYIKELRAEYRFLQSKFSLNPLAKEIWKYFRVRPVNFPSVRIAQLSALAFGTESMFSKILETGNMHSLMELFSVQASEYWDCHYDFEKPSPVEPKTLGKDSVYAILINTIVPFLFVYGKEKSLPALCNRALTILEEIPPEKNTVSKLWNSCGVQAVNALDTQGLLQLYNVYCRTKSCLKCEIGTHLIRSTHQMI